MAAPGPAGGALLPIGRLARLGRLTVKALRLYADQGLLEPAWIDPDSGYRYYRREQVRTAATIALLRSLDVPLAAVREILASPEPAALAAALERERGRVERDLARRRTALRSLERLLDARALAPYDVDLVDEPPRHLLALSAEVAADRMTEHIGALARRLVDVAVREGWPLAGGVVGLYPLDLPDAFRVVLGVAVPPGTPPAGGAEAVALDAGPAVTTVHVGAYDELPLAYSALMTWAHERGHELAEPVLERYLTDPGQAPPHELVTRIAIPVR